jgi:hypothetical protein
MAWIRKIPARLWVLSIVFLSSGVAFNIFTGWMPRYVALNCARIEAQYVHVPSNDYVSANVLWIIPGILSVAISRYTSAYVLCLIIWALALLAGLNELGPHELTENWSCVEHYYMWRAVAQIIFLIATIAIAGLALVVAVVRVGRQKNPS